MQRPIAVTELELRLAALLLGFHAIEPAQRLPCLFEQRIVCSAFQVSGVWTPYKTYLQSDCLLVFRTAD